MQPINYKPRSRTYLNQEIIWNCIAIVKIAIGGGQERIINVVCCVGRVELYKSKYKTVGVLPIRIVKSNVSSVALRQRGTSSKGLFLSDEGPTLETFRYIRDRMVAPT